MSETRLSSEERTGQQFHALLKPMLNERSDPGSFPSTLATATHQVLQSDGAGLSLMSGTHRVPIGSSTSDVVDAERLQFTVGDGPCLQAVADARSVRVDADQMQEQWPFFYSELRARSPFRSIVAVPMTIAPGLRGALDVYYNSESMPLYSALRAASVISVEIAKLLGLAATLHSDLRWSAGELPDWVYGTQSRQRLRLWIAVGILTVGLNVNLDTALSRLRAYAYTNSSDVDQISDALVAGKLTAEDLT